MTLPYHRWPRSYGGWMAGALVRCEGEDCQYCKSKFRLVDPATLEDVMTDEEKAEIEALIARARYWASKKGSMHSLWDLILDAECMLGGMPTVLRRDEVLKELRRVAPVPSEL